MSLLGSLLTQVGKAQKPKKERKGSEEAVPCYDDFESAMRDQGFMTVREIAHRMPQRTTNAIRQCLRFTLEPRNLVECKRDKVGLAKEKLQYRWKE